MQSLKVKKSALMFNRLGVCRAAWASESSASQATATRHEIRSDALCSKPKLPYGRREKMKKKRVFIATDSWKDQPKIATVF